MTTPEDLVRELDALPDIMHARITPIEQRETEYVLPASLKFRLIAALQAQPAPQGDVVEAGRVG